MAAIDGPAGPSMATKSAMDGPAGPVVAGDHLRHDSALGYTTGNELIHVLSMHLCMLHIHTYPWLFTTVSL